MFPNCGALIGLMPSSGWNGSSGVPITASDFQVCASDARYSLTAGQLWDLIAAKLWATSAGVPADGWQRVVVALSEALNVKPWRITSDSRLYADLGMLYGVD